MKKIWCDSVGCNYIKMSRFFPKLYQPFGIGIKVKFDLSNYATKTDIKNISMLILRVLKKSGKFKN